MRSNVLKSMVVAGFALTLAGVPDTSSAAPSVVVALIASNAQGAFTEIIKEFEATHKGVTIKPNYLGGTQIGTMIDESQPADVVLVGSGTTDKEAQLLGAPVAVLRNREVVLVPKNNPANIKTFKDIANPGVKLAIGTSGSAVGKLASQVIQNGAAVYGFDFVKNVRDNVKVQAEKGSDVVGAVGGAANAAIAFESDKDDAKFITIPIEEKFNVISTYNMAIPKNAKNPEMAKQLIDLVSGSAGQAVLHRFNYMSAK